MVNSEWLLLFFLILFLYICLFIYMDVYVFWYITNELWVFSLRALHLYIHFFFLENSRMTENKVTWQFNRDQNHNNLNLWVWACASRKKKGLEIFTNNRHKAAICYFLFHSIHAIVTIAFFSLHLEKEKRATCWRLKDSYANLDVSLNWYVRNCLAFIFDR